MQCSATAHFDAALTPTAEQKEAVTGDAIVDRTKRVSIAPHIETAASMSFGASEAARGMAPCPLSLP